MSNVPFCVHFDKSLPKLSGLAYVREPAKIELELGETALDLTADL